MPEPISMLILGKYAVGVAGKMAVKAYFLGKMVGLQAFLASYLGSQVATISVGVLASATTIVYWQKHVLGNTDDKAIEAAVAKGVSRSVARGIVKWLASSQ